MLAPSSFRLTRSVLTSTRVRTAINPTSTANLYRPLFTPKFFTTTSKMSEHKQGVHNLQT
jgi:thioredoxin 1